MVSHGFHFNLPNNDFEDLLVCSLPYGCVLRGYEYSELLPTFQLVFFLLSSESS